jgi:hypothetical protein
MMSKINLLIVSLLLSSTTYANEYIKYGVGLNGVPGATKSLFVGYQADITQVFMYQLEMGGYRDTNQVQGAVGLVSASIGVNTISTSGVYMKVFFGPCFNTQGDSRISGNFQFNNDIELGIKGINSFSIGLDFKHISNAGLLSPNQGRDFLMLKLQLAY